MSIVVTKSKQYEVAEEGMHQAVLGDIIDLGERQTSFGPRDQVRFVWLTDKDDSEGKPIRVIQTFTKSLDDRSNLYKAIRAIYDRAFAADSFDIETLLGSNMRLVIEHTESEGKTYANVSAMLRLEKGMPALEVPSDFVRRKDQKTNGNGKANGAPRQAAADTVKAAHQPAPPAADAEDDSIPF